MLPNVAFTAWTACGVVQHGVNLPSIVSRTSPQFVPELYAWPVMARYAA